MSYRSETSTVRDQVCGKWIFPEKECGVDLGFGGDPISMHSIAMDLPTPYAQTHDEYEHTFPQHLRGDARDLRWFADGALDYVYSSHLLEDFANPIPVLAEWLRVLRSGGKLVLFLPDEMKYRKHCAETGQPYNANHQNPSLCRAWMRDLLNQSPELRARLVADQDVEPYSFLVVWEAR